jgi:hypothetical protein
MTAPSDRFPTMPPACRGYGFGNPSTPATAAASTSISAAHDGMNVKTGNFAGANRVPLA